MSILHHGMILMIQQHLYRWQSPILFKIGGQTGKHIMTAPWGNRPMDNWAGIVGRLGRQYENNSGILSQWNSGGTGFWRRRCRGRSWARLHPILKATASRSTRGQQVKTHRKVPRKRISTRYNVSITFIYSIIQQ